MTKQNFKQCCVRLHSDLHRRAKLHAYEKGMTLQSWIASIIRDAITKDSFKVRVKNSGIEK